MTKDELQAKRAVALNELKDIEVALCLDEHYIDIIEKENAELKNVERMALYSKLSDQLTKATKIIKNLLILKNDHYGNTKMEWRVEVTEQAEQFLKEIEK